MLDDNKDQEIEASLLFLGCGYATLILVLIVTFAGHVG